MFCLKDSYDRRIRYMRISLTDLCNLRCMYCMPADGIDKKAHSDILSLEEIYKVVEAAHALGVNKVRLTGGEPLLRKNVISLIERIAQLPNIDDFAMTTNGTLLAENAAALKRAGLNRVNVSLDTLDAKKYELITRGGDIMKTIEGIDAAIEAGLTPLKINAVLVGGFNDDEIERLAALTIDRPVHVRFIELMPIGQASSWSSEKFISNEAVKRTLPLIPEIGEMHGPAEIYSLPGALGKIGLINPVSHAFCSHCDRIRMTPDGKLKPCLMTDDEIDIKSVLRSGGDLGQAILSAVRSKPRQSAIGSGIYMPVERDMYRIGG